VKPHKRRPGRPTALTDDVLIRARAAVAGGLTLPGVAGLVGVHASTLARWLREGELLGSSLAYEELDDDQRRKVDLYTTTSEAEAMLEARLLRAWIAAAPTSWRAAAHLLERRYPNRWGPKVTVSVANDVEILELLEDVLGSDEHRGITPASAGRLGQARE
jgi:hypothetical protein